MPLAASFKTTFLFLNNSPAGTADAPLRTFSQGFQVSFPRANLLLYVLMSRARVKSLPWTVTASSPNKHHRNCETDSNEILGGKGLKKPTVLYH